MKAYRVITDEPQGICVLFRPPVGFDYDVFELVEDDYPCETELYVFISLDGKKLAITMDDNYGHRKAQYPDWPADHEPDLFVWRNMGEFNNWKAQQ